MTTLEHINFLQRYIIVHSYIYYELNDNYISDKDYDSNSRELAKYRDEYPELWNNSMYYKQFGDDYNGATGFTLFHDLDDHQKQIIKSIVNSIKYNKRK